MIAKTVRWFYRKATGKTEQELATIWAFEYFLSRNRAAAYWNTLKIGVAGRFHSA